MIKSMTGFGRGEFADENRIITVEIKSVNHRYCDINVKMPRKYSFAEDDIRKVVKQNVKRGKIEIGVTTEVLNDSESNVSVNVELAKQYVENLQHLKQELNFGDELSLRHISSLPDVMKLTPAAEAEDEIRMAIVEATNMALKAHSAMREKEAQALVADLQHRGDIIIEKLAILEARAPEMMKEYVEKLKGRINELVDGAIDIPEERVLLEAAVFADKSNITEEIVRLKSHVKQLNDILSSENAEGKKLDFLIQEMNREANTIGSKANDLDVTSVVLDIKGEVEKIREQVQNIE